LNHNEYGPLRREYSGVASRYDLRWKFYIEASTQQTLTRFHLAPEDRVLDVGCGTGVLLESLARASPQAQLTGVDLSGDMLKIARRRLGSGLDIIQHGKIAAVGVPQENKSHNRQEVFITGVVGIGAQIVRTAPEPFFNGFYIF